MKKSITFMMIFLLAVALAACSAGISTTQTTSGDSAAVTVPIAASAAEALTTKSGTHDTADDYTWDAASAISIVLNGDAILSNAAGVQVNGSTATISDAGTYNLSGSLTDGQIIVDSQSEQAVRLILNGVNISNSTSAPINIVNARKTILILVDNTENVISDGTTYVFADSETDEPNAAIFSKSDLTISGNGSLTVNGNYNDGIASKDGLIIASGTISVNAVDDGIRGKDYLVVKNGNLTVNAGGDGLKSDNEEDAAKGYISIENGVFNLTSNGDALTAQTDVLIAAGNFTLTTGGGNVANLGEDASAKGIKAVANLNIDSGLFTINSADDALHTNGNLVVNTGTFNITAGDDGMHADATLTINGGDINITESYEGIESAAITINNGNIHVISSDDGINVAAGNDGSGMQGPGGGPGAPGGRPGGQTDTFTYTGSNYLYLNGGTIVVDARGDGVDVNGAVEMTDGILLVNGPTEQGNGALDYDNGFNLTGGFVVAAGSSGMAMAPGSYSSVNSALVYLTSSQPAGTLFHIQNSAGEDILTFAPSKDYQSVAFSSPKLVTGETYTISLGGSSTGTVTDGLYQGGAYSSGTEFDTFTVSTVVTTIGSGGGRGVPGRP